MMIISALFSMGHLCRKKARDSKEDFDRIKPVRLPLCPLILDEESADAEKGHIRSFATSYISAFVTWLCAFQNLARNQTSPIGVR